MFQDVNEMARKCKTLTYEEHLLFCGAYCQVFGDKSRQLRLINAQEGGGQAHSSATLCYRQRVEFEMRQMCLEGAKVLEDYLIPCCCILNNKIVYQKMSVALYRVLY